MKFIYSLLIPFAFLFSAFVFPQESKVKDELRNAAEEFMGELKNVLQKNIKEGGAAQAVKVCSDTAQSLSNDISEKLGLKITRVSLKPRNPKNSPDEYETAVLQKFEEMKNSGELNDDTEIFESFKENGVTTVRYMKPITTQGVCVLCHGSEKQVNREVTEYLSKTYPNDKARGYKPGDVRGAISIVKTY